LIDFDIRRGYRRVRCWQENEGSDISNVWLRPRRGIMKPGKIFSSKVVFLAVMAAIMLDGSAFTRNRAAFAAAPSCEALTALALPNATITSAQAVAAGKFEPPAPARVTKIFMSLPAFCRVTATLKPTSDSNIQIEVWMPVLGWNNQLQAVGNGAFGGSISYSALAAAVNGGYASVSTDTGHEGSSAAFGMGHPEKLLDFSYRAVHDMTVQAKAIIQAYYVKAPNLSIWNGCSTGGHQGLIEATKYPADFDGIIAGDPGVNWMRLHIARMAINATVHRSEDSDIPSSKYPLIHQAALQACDSLDGVKDGVIEDPTRCHFDPKVLQCKAADGPDCLTPAQVETARALYGPVKDPQTGVEIEPAMLQPGPELAWGVMAGPEPMERPLEAFKYFIHKDPNWDWHTFNPATDIDTALKTETGVVDLPDHDVKLKPFFDHGGKLLMYHGWADAHVTPMSSVEFFNDVVSQLGQRVVGKSIQLYMVPGMDHCGGGPGTDTFDKVSVIEKWIATGSAPDEIVASHLTDGKIDRTRPLCPLGKVATYTGRGSTDDAENFTCTAAH
jgi:feruloyl esterase